MGEGRPEAPSLALSKCTSTSITSDKEVEEGANTLFPAGLSPPPPGHCPPQRSPLLPQWSSHLASYFWPRGRRSETRLGGSVCGKSPDQSSGAGHTLWAALLLCPAPPPHPHPTTSPSPRTGQALATPRLHPKGEVVLTAPPVQYSPFSHRKPSP